MFSKEFILKLIECKAYTETSHIVKDPISLPCGFSVCIEDVIKIL